MTEEKSEFVLRPVEDGMALVLDCTLPGGSLLTLARAICSELLNLEVKSELETDRLAALLESLRDDGPEIESLELLRGRPPEPPVDGRIDWTADYFSSGFVVDEETGRIDYRRRAAQTSVEAGQELARLIPPVEGKPGEDIFGKPVAPPKPKTPRLRAGSNVAFDEAVGIFTAESAGRIKLRNGTVTVDNVYTVQGSVGLETGNIDHPGALVVEKDIESGAQVKAAGDIEVKGTVEAAVVQAEGSLTVRGGITGGEGCHIAVSGSVHARFIMDADLEARGDIAAEREIIHSQVKTRGAVAVPGGRILGGRVVALKGVTAGQIGSEACAPTDIHAGEDFMLQRELAPIEEQLQQVESNLKRMTAKLKPLLPMLDRLNEGRRRAVAAVLARMKETEQARDELLARKEALIAKLRAERKNIVLVRGVLYPETTLHMQSATRKIKDKQHGPVRVHFSGGEIVLGDARGTGEES